MNSTPDAIEMIDECTADGVATGRIFARREIHRHGYLHATVHLWIANSKGELLLQKRAMSKRSYPGRWDVSVAGHISSGDSPLLAVVREATEEIGLTVDPTTLTLLGRNRQSLIMAEQEYHDNELTYIYALRLDTPLSRFTLQLSEVTAIAWRTVDQINDIFKNEPNTLVPHEDEWSWAMDWAVSR